MKAPVLMAAALVFVAAAAASAQETGMRGRWSGSFSGGATMPAGGESHEGGRGTVLGLPTSVDARSSKDGSMPYHVIPGGDLGPYVSLFAGSRRVEAIPGTFSVPAAGVVLRDPPDLPETEGLPGTGLENLNNAGSRWSVPIPGVARFAF